MDQSTLRDKTIVKWCTMTSAYTGTPKFFFPSFFPPTNILWAALLCQAECWVLRTSPAHSALTISSAAHTHQQKQVQEAHSSAKVWATSASPIPSCSAANTSSYFKPYLEIAKSLNCNPFVHGTLCLGFSPSSISAWYSFGLTWSLSGFPNGGTSLRMLPDHLYHLWNCMFLGSNDVCIQEN